MYKEDLALNNIQWLLHSLRSRQNLSIVCVWISVVDDKMFVP